MPSLTMIPTQAIEALARMNRNEVAQLEPNDCILANWLEDSGHPIAATRLLRSCLANHQQTENLAGVYLMLGLMLAPGTANRRVSISVERV